MEFTPRKQPLSPANASVLRHNPYASGGGQFLKNFRRRPNSNVSPPRSAIPKRFNNTRTYKMLSTSRSRSLGDKPVSVKTPLKPKSSPPKISPKRPILAVNQSDNDPYKVCSDIEGENLQSPRKETKREAASDKENVCLSDDDVIFPLNSYKKQKSKSPFERQKPKTLKVYSNKRKSILVARSRLVNDISPEKVEKAYRPKVLFSPEKENVPSQPPPDSSVSEVLLPHLIGFPNYGNTCYLNSVLQSLFGLPSFLWDYRQIALELGLNHTSLFYGLGQVLSNRMKGQASGVKVSVRTVKENLERIDGSFTGFKMQDANEFLTKVLDTIKDEIDRCYASQSDGLVSPPESQGSLQKWNSSKDLDEDVFLNGAKRDVTKVLNFTPELEVNSEDSEIVTILNKGAETCSDNAEVGQNTVTDAKEESVTEKQPPNILSNPVKENFEFQLLESYKCLGCGEVEGKTQPYFGLYVNLPESGGHTTIQDAVSTYMAVDERELTCDKCGHNASSVITSIRSLPRILIIQLKRYEYKPEKCESIKMSSKVLVNRWISLEDHMTDDVSGPSQWNTHIKTTTQSSSTLTVRNLSSEMNKCDSQDDDDLPTLVSPAKPLVGASSNTGENEDEELQMAMRRSMEETQGGKEEQEIQEAIRLSLQEMGMSYSQENQETTHEQEEEEEEEEEQEITIQENQESDQHAYRLISIISHFGLTTNTGHYVSDVYNCEEDSWFHYDDESVSKISESVVFAEGRQKNGYIFFYMHKDLFQKVKNVDNR